MKEAVVAPINQDHVHNGPLQAAGQGETGESGSHHHDSRPVGSGGCPAGRSGSTCTVSLDSPGSFCFESYADPQYQPVWHWHRTLAGGLSAGVGRYESPPVL